LLAQVHCKRADIILIGGESRHDNSLPSLRSSRSVIGFTGKWGTSAVRSGIRIRSQTDPHKHASRGVSSNE
jgi:hypothetical protein